MTTNYTDTEKNWTANPVAFTEDAAVTISAWTTDEEIADQAEVMATSYGNEFELDTILRLFRSELRRAAMDAAKSRSRK